MKVVALDRAYWPRGGYGHWCPACGNGHEIDTEQKNSSGAIWKFNGNIERPTFTPSINMKWGRYADPSILKEHPNAGGGICHYIITDGKITYCKDCTHAMKGQTVALPDIPAGKYVTSIHAARGA